MTEVLYSDHWPLYKIYIKTTQKALANKKIYIITIIQIFLIKNQNLYSNFYNNINYIYEQLLEQNIILFETIETKDLELNIFRQTVSQLSECNSNLIRYIKTFRNTQVVYPKAVGVIRVMLLTPVSNYNIEHNYSLQDKQPTTSDNSTLLIPNIEDRLWNKS